MKFKAAILVQQGKELVIDEVTCPESLAYGQVLVKIHYSGICGSQLGEIDGVKGPDKFLPHLLGHEGSGEVIEVGPEVTRVKVGDKVVLHWRKASGIEAPLPKYNWNGKVVNSGWVTTFSEYSVVSENRLTPIPDDFDMKLAALYGCAVTTGFGVVTNDAKLTLGQSIIIFGAGGVGLNMIQAASMSSAYPIIAIDLFDTRLDLAKELGADFVINSTKTDVQEELQKILPQGADVTVDNTGKPTIIELCYELTKNSGTTVLVGVPKKGDKAQVYTLPLHFGKNLKGSCGGGCEPESDIPKFIQLFKAGKYSLEPLITNEYRLDDINQAMADMRSGKVAGRCLIDMDM
ncbi:zinc-binding dehydrogenase [Lentisphaera marina]|uniref:zinc-binding dehydrogenase n=1 Tax=Lentisphaera marina TaxID=1111041 RepID=UPI002366ACB8|nr:zinc-binding dehydrogenase [Lentisphaera marina]MDD7985732.1 zinc-binding dehydrogenase [Lentisphaera marina]